MSETKWVSMTIYLNTGSFSTLYFYAECPIIYKIYIGCSTSYYDWLGFFFFFNKTTCTYIHKMKLISPQRIHFGQLYINSTEENSKRDIPKILWLMGYVYIFPKGTTSKEITHIWINRLWYICLKICLTNLSLHTI